jgi:RNA polymerase sigma factor (sigma-70 family)
VEAASLNARAFGSSPRLVPLRLMGDNQLARMVARGESAAFEQIYERHHQQLYRYARAIVRNDEDARDVVQNAMTDALRALRAGGSGRDIALKPWLYTIVRNEAISLLRRRRPHLELDLESSEAGTTEAPADDDTRERLEQLLADLRNLSERQRQALLMRELAGLDYDEIAASLDVKPNAARQAVFEARAALGEISTGRQLGCETIRRSIAAGDRRAMRGRRLRAHMRSCDACRDLELAFDRRRRDLALLAPGLSAPAAAGLLQAVLGAAGIGGGAGGAAVVASAAGAGGLAAAGAGALKGFAVTAAVVGAGVGVVAVKHEAPAHKPAVARVADRPEGAPRVAKPAHAHRAAVSVGAARVEHVVSARRASPPRARVAPPAPVPHAERPHTVPVAQTTTTQTPQPAPAPSAPTPAPSRPTRPTWRPPAVAASTSPTQTAITAAIDAAREAAEAAIAAASGSGSFADVLAAATRAGTTSLQTAGQATTSIIGTVEDAIRSALGGLFRPRTYTAPAPTTQP